MVLRCRMPARVAVATSVFALAITAVAGAAMHALAAEPAWEVVKWSIPGVLIGSTIGSHVGKHLPARAMERGLAVVCSCWLGYSCWAWRFSPEPQPSVSPRQEEPYRWPPEASWDPPTCEVSALRVGYVTPNCSRSVSKRVSSK